MGSLFWISGVRTAQLFGWACIILIIAFSLVPGEARPHTGVPGQLEHFVAYLGTGMFFSLGHHLARERIMAWLALTSLSLTMEIMQHLVPGRSPGFLDAVASTCGAGIGLIIGSAFHSIYARRVT